MRVTFLSLFLIVGCAAEDPADTMMTSGSYLGVYEVPTTPELEAAATYPVDHVDWTVANGIATLHYELPLGLVGGELPITLSGPIAAGDTTVMLNSAQGVGTCVAEGTVITCHEDFAGLGDLPLSMTMVEQLAAAEYPGPVADRVEVALAFGSDPIGIVIFDLTTPGIDDHGGDDD